VPLRKPGKLPSKSIGVDFKQSAGKGAAYFGKDRLEMHEDGLKPGSRVLIIDDMLGTGSTMYGACELVRFVYLYVYIYVCMYIYICVCVCVYTYVYMYIHTYIYTHICIHVYIYLYIDICMLHLASAFRLLHTRIYIHIYRYRYIHICMLHLASAFRLLHTRCVVYCLRACVFAAMSRVFVVSRMCCAVGVFL